MSLLRQERVLCDDPLLNMYTEPVIEESSPPREEKEAYTLLENELTNECIGLGSSGISDSPKSEEAMSTPSETILSPSSPQDITTKASIKILQMSSENGMSEKLEGEQELMRIQQVRFTGLGNHQMSGTLFMTNHKLFFDERRHISMTKNDQFLERFLDSFFTLPLGTIDRIERVGRKKEEMLGIIIHSRDNRMLQFDFERDFRERVFSCLENFAFPDRTDQLFCFSYMKAISSEFEQIPSALDGWNIYQPENEFRRQGIFSETNLHYYSYSNINNGFNVCESYPSHLVLPRNMSTEEIYAVAAFRSKGRIPALTWIHPSNTSSLWRCSQPKVGLNSSRCLEDEKMLKTLSRINSSNRIVWIVDARPKLNAYGNRFTGAGFENTEFYTSAEITFMNIQNIHAVRDSFNKLYKLCNRTGASSNLSWLSSLESSGWLSHISEILRATFLMVHRMETESSTILVHCSDGWDRTSQLASLSQICLDPHFRSIQGFFQLIEKEWTWFGHKFQTRTGFGSHQFDDDQRSPIFLQWIDCVWQLLRQFPREFEFNAAFLLELVDQMHSCRFGTFLMNSEKQRLRLQTKKRTMSLWTYFILQGTPDRFKNSSYSIAEGTRVVLFPAFLVRKLALWDEFWLRWNSLDVIEDTMRPPELGHSGVQLKFAN